MAERITIEYKDAHGRTVLEWARIVARRAIAAGHQGRLKIHASPEHWEICCLMLGHENRPYSIETVEHKGIIHTHLCGRVVLIFADESAPEYPYA